jgi:hypothetical protein
VRVRKLCSEIFNRNRLPAEPMRVKGKPPIFPQPECQSRVAATQNITAHIPDPGQHVRRSYGASLSMLMGEESESSISVTR